MVLIANIYDGAEEMMRFYIPAFVGVQEKGGGDDDER